VQVKENQQFAKQAPGQQPARAFFPPEEGTRGRRVRRDRGRGEGDIFIAISTYDKNVSCNSLLQPNARSNVVSHAHCVYFIVSTIPNENGDFDISGDRGLMGSAKRSSAFSSSGCILAKPVLLLANAFSEAIPDP